MHDTAGEGKGAQAETDAAVAAGNSSDAAVGNLDAATLDSEAASSESTSAAMSESTVAETEESADVAETEPVEEEKSYLTSPLTAEAGGLKVTVTPTEDAALPEDTQLDVREITSSDTAFQGMEEEAEKTAWEQNGKVEDMGAALPYEKFLAISLKEGDQEIEPQAQVGVKVELADTDASLIHDGVSFGVLHYTDGEAVSVTPQVDTQSDDDKEENKMSVDCKAPTMAYEDFLDGENRYAALRITFPENAEKLFKQASDDAIERYERFKKQEEM